MNKETLAKEYAHRIAGDLIEKALEAAYLEGFEAGKRSLVLDTVEIDGITYYDLGLSSGTLWSEPLINSKEKLSFSVGATYLQANELEIPTREDVEELIRETPYSRGFRFRTDGKIHQFYQCRFWMKDSRKEGNNKALIFNSKTGKIEETFIGDKLSVVLVKRPEKK